MPQDIWALTVHFYPAATEAGLQPVETTSFADWAPARYHSHTFYFSKPPRRDDFFAMCRRVYWTQCWSVTLFPLIAAGRGEWPMVDCGRKAAEALVRDELGREVGRLVVRRQDLYAADGYDRVRVFIDLASVERISKRVAVARRDEARRLFYAHEHRLQEQISNLAPEADVEKFIADRLTELFTSHGLIGKGSRSPRRGVASSATV